jgi:amino acid transporter
LGTFSLFALGVNGIVGVGIFFVPLEIARLVPGAGGAWVYVATALALAPIAVIYGRLASRFPVDGGPYVWARAAFGERLAYFVGFIAWVSALFSTAAVMVGLATHLGPWLSPLFVESPALLGLLLVFGLGAVAASGLVPSAIVWDVLTCLKLAPLLGLALLWAWADPSSAAAAPVAAQDPSWGVGDALLRAALLAVFTCQGFEIVPLVAGKARERKRSVALATLGSLLAAGALYGVLHAACAATLPTLATAEAPAAPLAAAAGVLGGGWAERVVAAGTQLSALGIAFGMVSMTPRYLAALGNDGGLGVRWGREDSGVPRLALAVTLLLVLGFVFAGSLVELFALSSIAVSLQFAVSVAAFVRLEWPARRGDRARALGSTLLRARALLRLWPAPLAALALALVLAAAELRELGVLGGCLIVGGAVRWLSARGPLRGVRETP